MLKILTNVTFNASVADFKKHLQSWKTRSGSIQVRIWNADLAVFATGTFSINDVQHVLRTSEVTWILERVRFFWSETFSNTTTSINCLLYDNDLVLPTSGSKRLQRAVLLQAVKTFEIQLTAALRKQTLESWLLYKRYIPNGRLSWAGNRESISHFSTWKDYPLRFSCFSLFWWNR